MTYNYNEKLYNVNIIRKNNKNLYIRVSDNLEVNITCPFYYTNKMIEKVIKENTRSINKMFDNVIRKNNLKNKDSILGNSIEIIYDDVSKPKENGIFLTVKDENMLNRWYKRKALVIFKQYLDEAYYVFKEDIPYPKLKIRTMKTRWGVCNRRDNSVTLNLELIKKDQECLNYVIVHELSHFVHFDHSKEFWKTVEKYCPDYKRVRKELKQC